MSIRAIQDVIEARTRGSINQRQLNGAGEICNSSFAVWSYFRAEPAVLAALGEPANSRSINAFIVANSAAS